MTAHVLLPPENDLLCESCGYPLVGLGLGEGSGKAASETAETTAARCPECGTPIADSLPATRRPTAWAERQTPRTWLATSTHALFQPRKFFRGLATRDNPAAAQRFALWHAGLFGLLAVVAAGWHLGWTFLGPNLRPYVLAGRFSFDDFRPLIKLGFWVFVLPLPVIVLLTLGVRRLAGQLTALEAGWRGVRLPLPVVQTTLAYHSVHLLPPVLAVNAVVLGNLLLLAAGLVDATSHAEAYLYVLSGTIVVAAGYAFGTYWLAMKRVMHANA